MTTREDRNETTDARTGQTTVEVVTVDTTAETNRSTIDAAVTAALAQLQALIDLPPVAVIPAGSRTLAQLTADVRALRDGVQANRAGSQQIAAALRRTLRLVRGDFAGTD